MEVAATVDAFIADPTTTAFLFGGDYRIDLAAAVAASNFAALVMKDCHADDAQERFAVRTAILLARAQKG